MIPRFWWGLLGALAMIALFVAIHGVVYTLTGGTS